MARCIRYKHSQCDKVCQWLATGLRFSPGTPVSSTNKTDRHDITEILLKVVLSTISISPEYSWNTASWAIVSQPIKKNIIISNQGGQMVKVVDLITLPSCGSRSDFHVKCQGFPILLKLDLHTCSLFSIRCLLVAAPTHIVGSYIKHHYTHTQFHFVLRFTYLQCLLLFHLVD